MKVLLIAFSLNHAGTRPQRISTFRGETVRLVHPVDF